MTIVVPGDSAPDALVVPVSALVALAEGGYAVEVVVGTLPDGSLATQYVAVEPGLFADGFVAVTSPTLQEGDQVVVPGHGGFTADDFFRYATFAMSLGIFVLALTDPNRN